MLDEYFDIIDDATNEVIGRATRRECHSDPSLVHRAVRVVIFDTAGRILLQKRSMNKDIQPGKWDTAVGGHLDSGEDYLDAAKREMREELGITDELQLKFLFDIKVRNERESENVRTYSAIYEGPVSIQESELECALFHDTEILRKKLDRVDTDDFTPLLEIELRKILF